MRHATSPSCSGALLQRQAMVHGLGLVTLYLLLTQPLTAGCAGVTWTPAACPGRPPKHGRSRCRATCPLQPAHTCYRSWSVQGLVGLGFGWGTVWLVYSLVGVGLILQQMCDGTISTGPLHTTH